MLETIRTLAALAGDVSSLIAEIVAGHDENSPGGEAFTEEEKAKVKGKLDKLTSDALALL